MTPAQALRLRGIQEVGLPNRGFTLQTETGVQFQALIAWAPSELPQFELGPGEWVGAVIHVLRGTMPNGVGEQALLTDIDSGETWRVLYVENNPVNVNVLLYCQIVE